MPNKPIPILHAFHCLEHVRSNLYHKIESNLKQLEESCTDADRIPDSGVEFGGDLMCTLRSLTALELGIFKRVETERQAMNAQGCEQSLVGRLSKILRNSKYLNANEITQILALIEGICLLHYASKTLFRDAEHMKSLLGLLHHSNKRVVIASMDCVEAVLVDSAASHRSFESMDGVSQVCRFIAMGASVHHSIRIKCVELLSLYIMPETECPDLQTDPCKLQSQSLHYSASKSKLDRVSKLMGNAFLTKLLESLGLQVPAIPFHDGIQSNVPAAAEPTETGICAVGVKMEPVRQVVAAPVERKQAMIGRGPRVPRQT
ncbi:cell division control protein 14, SIN component-domain-containing protein [Chytriomyces cf. hyalinus JEL632]|nr:cell division control protein 14, SIN component-domain-containing protein [Chytriomyces cf. hyalinus JEL632]